MIIERMRAKGADIIRTGYTFRLRPGSLDGDALAWIAEHLDDVKREVWPAYDDWHERAAIMEYDGGMMRADAEAAAYGRLADAGLT